MIRKQLKNNRLIEYGREIASRFFPKLYLKLLYYYYFRERLDLKHPKTLDEKIQWMKLNLYPYETNTIYTKCADKYAVREYVKSKGLENILNDIIAVYDNVEDIDWDSLPNQFAMKWNFGNGLNIICNDKSKLDKEETLNTMRKWGNKKAWTKTYEPQYRYIPKKIIVESLIDDGNGGAPYDYKIYCFHGEVKCIMLCVGREKGKPKFYFFDENWELVRINPDSINAPTDFTLPKPKHLSDMLEAARILSSPFPFVRVDFFDTPNKFYFGELTFTPSGGFDTADMKKGKILLGSYLNLNI